MSLGLPRNLYFVHSARCPCLCVYCFAETVKLIGESFHRLLTLPHSLYFELNLTSKFPAPQLCDCRLYGEWWSTNSRERGVAQPVDYVTKSTSRAAFRRWRRRSRDDTVLGSHVQITSVICHDQNTTVRYVLSLFQGQFKVVLSLSSLWAEFVKFIDLL